jgi:hypothetical protein
MSDTHHLIGLLLGTEEDWPTAFETITARMGDVVDAAGATHRYDVERITIEPFDRLAYWYYHPREWLKKVALVDDVYLLNSPFTFQSMEKHAAYCAMIRLGLNVPDTVLVPYKNPVDHAKYPYTASKYNQPFDLDAIAEQLGYPLFMKPYDGGAWVGVSQVHDAAELHQAYDESGQRLMHLQKAVADYDVFARSLSIGAETMVMNFDPSQPMHARYSISHGFLDDATGREAVTIGRLVNAFFRWEFNSCETLIKDGVVYPIDYANACPDVALTSLHYYFPWAMKALVKWSVFCTATGRRPRFDPETRSYFDVADRQDLSYEEKLTEYRAMADAYFDVEHYTEFCATQLGHLDEVVLEWVEGPDFDRLLVDNVAATFPPHEHDQFIAHYRGLLAAWAKDERGSLAAR